ncbi:MAG TPA: response regulator [Verrucomicrobiae bacterium]|jgi:CheY-like chemotaxis protein|nr:response regulator [Verrucomicrobiae bacterium]
MEPKQFVLLVEDSYNDELLARRAFKKCQMADNLTVVRDGAEALDFLFGAGAHASRDWRQLPAVVLLDLKLPKLSGLEVLRRARADERTRTLPIIVLSSSDEENDKSESERLGANGYLRKPVEFKEFVETVRQLSLCWLQADGTLKNKQKNPP